MYVSAILNHMQLGMAVHQAQVAKIEGRAIRTGYPYAYEAPILIWGPVRRYVPKPLLAGFDKPTFCHFLQLSKLPKLATSKTAKIGNFQSCQNW